MTTKKIFIGVAWPYVNGDIHVGHLAGYLVPCDIFARYSRLKGYSTLMVSGTDCHGTPITVEADKRGITPLDLVNEYDPKVRELIKLYRTSYDLFTTTTTESHKKVTQEVFLKLLQNGYIFKKTSPQYYSQEDDKFLPDREVEGECPHCHAKDQRADQCESCGRTLGFAELINPRSKTTKSEVTLKDTEHYFIDFPKLQGKIKEFVNDAKSWRNWVHSETLGWLNEGLEPRAITRDLNWGVEIPAKDIPESMLIENIESKRFYVWFEAVIGYLSAAIEWSSYSETTQARSWEDFWRNKDCRHYYFMGKDNLAFHTIFWPGQLIGQEEGYNLPYFPCVNQNLNLEGKKFSKSRGVILDAKKAGEYFGADRVRFYIASIMPESKDANWKWDDFKDTINNELAGNIGNFIHRTLVFFNNKLEGKFETENIESYLDKDIEEKTKDVFEEISEDLENCRFVAAVAKLLKYSKSGNQYFDAQKPWVSIKEDRAACEKTIYNCLQIVYSLRTLLNPFMPNSSDKLSETLGLNLLDSDIQSQRTNLENKFEFIKLDSKEIKLTENIEPIFQKIEEDYIKVFLEQK